MDSKISSNNVRCPIEDCNNIGTQMIAIILDSDEDTEQYNNSYYVCGNHYDGLMKLYYKNKPASPTPTIKYK
jgi:hypothetical protein